MSTRLSKLIASRGVASRREAETLIAEGRVQVNGAVVTEVVEVDGLRDHVLVDDRPLPEPPERTYLILYKPRGTITGREDPQGRPSVFDLVDLPVRVEPVGRLDFDTEGALILTNDGELANALTHPSRHVPKRYLVKVYRCPSERDLDAIRNGVYLDDGRTQPAKVRVVESTESGNTWLEITVTEGRNRLIRRMLEQLGHPVSKLRRVSFGTVSITGLERGQARVLTGAEVARLRDLAAGTRPARAGKKKGKGFARAKPKKPRHSAKARARRQLEGA